MSDSTCGVLVFGVDASVRHVDAMAAELLDTTVDALLNGAAGLLEAPTSLTQPSLRSMVSAVLENRSQKFTAQLSSGVSIHGRPTAGPDGPSGVVVTVHPPNGASSPPAQNVGADTSTRQKQGHLLKCMARGASLDDVLNDLVMLIEEERPGMLGSILLYDASSGTLRHGAAPNLSHSFVSAIDGEPAGPNAGSCGTAAYLNETIIAEDINEDPRWIDYKEVALTHDLQACWSAPIRGEEGEVLGTFALYYPEPRSPSAADQSLIEEASYLASIAIEHDRHKQRLQIQSDQLRRLVENAQPAIFFLDADGRILIAEGENLQSVGLHSDELVGRSIYDLCANHPTLLRDIDRALSGETVDAVVDVDDVTFDIWYAPYYDRSGSVAGCIGMGVDISEQQKAERTLREHRDVLRRTQELAHVGGWEYDPRTNEMRGTEETYRICEVPLDANLTFEQALGLYPPETATTIREAAQRCLAEGVSFDEEGPLITPKGTRRWVRIRGEARWDGDDVTKMVGSIQDLSLRRAIEERLREQKRWLQSITDNISGGIYRSTDEALVYANQALVDMFGYDSLEEMAAIDPRELYANPSLRDRLTYREKREGGLDGTEVEFRRKDGSTFTGLLRSTQVVSENEERDFYDGVVTDITEQKAREEEIRNQWKKIKSLYAPSGVLLAADSPEQVAAGLINLVHDTFGYAGVSVHYHQNGRLVRCDVPDAEDPPLSVPNTISASDESFAARVFRTGEISLANDTKQLEDGIDYGEFRAIAGIPIGEYGVLTLGNPNTESIDKRDLYLIDILARKGTAVLARIEHEADLHASEQRFRGLFEEAALGIALLDADGEIVEVNPELESLVGYAADTLRGCTFATLGHPDDANIDAERFEALIRGDEGRYDVEKRYVRKSGEPFWGHLTVSQHHGPGRAEVIAMIQDISDQKRYERQLREAKQEAEEASRLKSNMLANMSHEIRTPLTSIIGFADTLRTTLTGSNARYAELVHQSGERLMNTLDSVLQLSKLEAGATSPVSETVDLITLTGEVVSLYSAEAESADIDLTFEAPTQSLVGTWDSAAVQRVLSNLLSNAIKFTPPPGSVWVEVRPQDDHVLLIVADSGIGIAESFRPRLFDAFTQESEGLKREHEGTGLGLAIVKRMVELMGGDVEVESTKGTGTCFVVRLPR